MSDPEIVALREVIAKRPRSDDIAQRRRDIDARGLENKLPADVTVEPVTANGVKSEWTSTPDADRQQGRAVSCMAAATSSARSTATGILLPRPDERRGRARSRSTIGSRRSIRSPPRSMTRSPPIVSCWRTACRLAASPSPATPPAAGWSSRRCWRSAMPDCRSRRAAGRISPWVDMEAIGDSMVGKAATDPTVQKAGILDMAKHYLNGADPRSPLAAPIYADLRGLAPLLIQVGAAETLLDDAIRLAQVAGAADVAVDLQIWPEMIHVWHIYYPELAAGRRAIAAGGEFARAMTSRGSRSGF